MSGTGSGTHDGGRVHAEGDFGWHLGVLLSAYQGSVAPLLGELPHATRGYQILAAVVHGDQPTQAALAAHLGIDRTVMTYVIDDLVEAGLVERRLNPADRRARKIVATPQGARTLADLEERVRQAEDGLLDALSAQERAAFRLLLRRTACRLRNVEPAADPCTAAESALKDIPAPR
ncbi:MarR family transcriptional regulator [Actinomadura craniellae]|uniref:MarR family transcriptional regulator n=1 Tax=Actinomadura craniellae TaxID=2231787 RepID=A0A365HDG0_9ACTN|nr:MarR family winged helix-turn-helix transcriptional regulator [Actinomadura craniellae]RAY17141.1 MarR family transcriptional regulator [Actinomadura craniellae]